MITQLDGLGIPVFTGTGRFLDNSRVLVEQLQKDPSKTGIIEADNFVVATGRCGAAWVGGAHRTTVLRARSTAFPSTRRSS